MISVFGPFCLLFNICALYTSLTVNLKPQIIVIINTLAAIFILGKIISVFINSPDEKLPIAAITTPNMSLRYSFAPA